MVLAVVLFEKIWKWGFELGGFWWWCSEFELLSVRANETGGFGGVCRSLCRLSSPLQKPPLSSALSLAVVCSISLRRPSSDEHCDQGSSLVVQQLLVIALHY